MSNIERGANMSFLCAIFLLVGIGAVYTLIEDKKFKDKARQEGKEIKPETKRATVIWSVVIIVCIVGVCTTFSMMSNSGSSSSSSSFKRQMEKGAKDTGTSVKEYTDTYKYIKSHGTK